MTAPLDVRRPSVMRRWTYERERPAASATNRSARVPAALSGTATVTRPAISVIGLVRGLAPDHRRRQEQHDRDADGRVGDVEGVEAPVADAHVHPVDDVAVADAVEQVAD